MRPLNAILASAREDLKKRWDDYPEDRQDIGDAIHEIADAHVPIYTSDLMALAAEHIALATDEPELGPAFDGTPTPVNIVAANVYEAITADLWEYQAELEAEEEEAEDDTVQTA